MTDSKSESQPRLQLAALGRDLPALAREGRLPPLHPRDELLDQLVALVSHRQHVLLVGPSGCGKTALVELLAEQIAFGGDGLPHRLAGRRIVESPVSAFQLDCAYVNQFETRVHNIVRQCGHENAILVLDRIEEALVAGACEGKEERTLANLLIPYLADPQVTVIGTTTPEGYGAALRQNPAFAERFRVLEVPPMTVDEAVLLVGSLAKRIEGTYGITLEPDAATEAAALGERFYPWRAFPGASVDLLRDAAARGRASAVLRRGRLTADGVREIMRLRSGLPAWLIDPAQPVRREQLTAEFEGTVYGQPAAVAAVVAAILAFKAELNDRRQPIASFLLLGPTGVGKTHLARTTARVLFGSEDRLLRYDMAEYSTWDQVPALAGSRSSKRRGLVTEVAGRPFTVILLDEIEKAHPNIQALLLPLLGEGRITDDAGRTANFANTIVFLTGNVGSHLYGKSHIGFEAAGGVRVTERELMEHVERAFLPEFLNRLTRIVALSPLSHETVIRIAGRELSQVALRPGLRRHAVSLSADDGALALLSEHGHSATYGARHMQRVIEELVVRPLAERLAAGDLPPGAEITVAEADGRLEFRTLEREPAGGIGHG